MALWTRHQFATDTLQQPSKHCIMVTLLMVHLRDNPISVKYVFPDSCTTYRQSYKTGNPTRQNKQQTPPNLADYVMGLHSLLHAALKVPTVQEGKGKRWRGGVISTLSGKPTKRSQRIKRKPEKLMILCSVMLDNAIAYNLRSISGLKVPIIIDVTGEGGSDGALAIGCADKLFMLDCILCCHPTFCSYLYLENILHGITFMEHAAAIAEGKPASAGLDLDIFTYKALLMACCKAERMQSALAVTIERHDRDIPRNSFVYNKLIDGWARRDDVWEAADLLQQMKQEWVQPDIRIYKSLVNAC
ncbi:tetratricopeptide-like helical domain-containing protein [Artemisia annua]|uniref:Tetratricopeptide-like helical domain-containing protein n=1 Tax=Artemisia annua TaxID=35608 RepID=A0A2U1L1K5_ARTAN|nr:tetratricopeptide-like helical domain-containing protein [Artemisia annua]